MKTFKVRVTLITGQWFDMTVQYDNDSVDKAFVAWCKVVKADGALYNETGCVPWHAIFSMLRVDAMEQQIILAGAAPVAGAKPN